jgi:hypothetical protein
VPGRNWLARRHDHAITQHIVAIRHHLALVHADAQADSVGLVTQPVLNRNGTAQRLRARELQTKLSLMRSPI